MNYKTKCLFLDLGAAMCFCIAGQYAYQYIIATTACIIGYTLLRQSKIVYKNG